jgi:hypothetical protein
LETELLDAGYMITVERYSGGMKMDEEKNIERMAAAAPVMRSSLRQR